jgi:hypothetical protein
MFSRAGVVDCGFVILRFENKLVFEVPEFVISEFKRVLKKRVIVQLLKSINHPGAKLEFDIKGRSASRHPSLKRRGYLNNYISDI